LKRQKLCETVSEAAAAAALKENGMDVEEDDIYFDADDSDNPDFPGAPPPKKTKSETFTLTFDDKEWIRKFCNWADRHRISDVAFLELLQELVVVGGGKIEDITLSLSTIYRIRDDERRHVALSIGLADYDDHVTVHFDGKRVKMGHLQGGETVEHLPVIVSGISGERQLGIEIAENSTG
jgi:hypothetical protein